MTNTGRTSGAADTNAGRGHRLTLHAALHRQLLVLLLPLILATGVVLWQVWDAQRASIQQGLLSTAGALVLAVDREVAAGQAIVETLAASSLIDQRDWRAFHEYAAATTRRHPGGLVALTDPSGQVLLNTAVAFGTSLPNVRKLHDEGRHIDWQGQTLPLSSQGLTQRVLDSGQAAYSGLYYGVSVKRPTVSVAIPVVRAGRVVYSLTYSFPPDGLGRFLGTTDATGAARLALIDNAGRVITTNGRTGTTTGNTVSAEFMARTRDAKQGVFEGVSRDGGKYLTAYAASDVSSWVVRSSVPRNAAYLPAYMAAIGWSGALIAIIGLALILTRTLARRVTWPLTELARSADRLALAEAPSISPSAIAEIDMLTQALARGSAAERARHDEQVRRLRAEERERATAAAAAVVQESEERFRQLAENIHDVFWITSHPDRQVLYVSPAYHRLWGLDASLVYGDPGAWKRLIHPDDQARVEAAYIAEGLTGRFDQSYRIRINGTVRWVRDRCFPLKNNAGAVYRVAGITEDITERRELEEQLRVHVQQLEAADRRKDQFLAMLGHELRNPLAPIVTMADALRAGPPLDDRVLRGINIIARQARQLARLIDDLLDVARITEGKIVLRRQVIDLQPAVLQAVESTRPFIEAHRHGVSLKFPPHPVRVEADSVRLVQIFTNLLTNAARYTPRGGRIDVRVATDGAEALIAVKDNGVGIAPERIAGLFEPFAQSHEAAARAQGGLGIGLALARRLVELHGGSLHADSAGPGRGSEFIVRLPLVAKAPAEVATPSHTVCAPSRRVLVVDDNVDAADSFSALLKLEGHEVQVAYNADSALAAAPAFKPECACLDIGLPGMDGYELGQRLRELDGLDGLVLIALTGYGQPEDRERSRVAGFHAHLVKPVDLDALHAVLARPTAGEPVLSG